MATTPPPALTITVTSSTPTPQTSCLVKIGENWCVIRVLDANGQEQSLQDNEWTNLRNLVAKTAATATTMLQATAIQSFSLQIPPTVDEASVFKFTVTYHKTGAKDPITETLENSADTYQSLEEGNLETNFGSNVLDITALFHTQLTDTQRESHLVSPSHHSSTTRTRRNSCPT